MLQTLWFWWDGDDHLRKAATVQDPNASPFFLASYNADGIRTTKDDTRSGVLTHNDFSWSPYGLLSSSTPNTVYTPGFGHRSNGINSFYQVDWLGSTRSVTDITGSTMLAAQSYEAFGHRDAQAPGSPNHPIDTQFATDVEAHRAPSFVWPNFCRHPPTISVFARTANDICL